MTFLRLDATAGTVTAAELGENTLRGLYREIGCTTVDVVRVAPGIDGWIDDEGLYKEPLVENALFNEIAAYFGHDFQQYYGNVVLATVDEEGDTVPLSDSNVALIRTILADAGCLVPNETPA